MIDLHTHSTVSDGSLAPRDLVRLAHDRRLDALALTDHDHIGGLGEAAREAAECGLEFIPGMEITVNFYGRKLHVLALNFDRESPAFRDLYRAIRADKTYGMMEVIGALQRRALPISVAAVRREMPDPAAPIDRYAVMRCLVRLRVVPKVRSLWADYIDPALNEVGVMDHIYPEAVFRAVRESGGVTSLAHFHQATGLGGMTRDKQAQAIARLHGLGLDALEGWYPTYSDDDRAFVQGVAERLHMPLTGGTDFHGANRPGTDLATGIRNNLNVPYEVWRRIVDDHQ